MTAPKTYIFTLPPESVCFKLLWEFLNEKKYQIHKSNLNEQNLVVVITCYFSADLLTKYINSNTERNTLKLFGKVKYKEKVKPVREARTYNKNPAVKRWKKGDQENKPSLKLALS